MKIIYSWGVNKEVKPLIEAEIREWINAGYDITSINHREVLGIDRAWSPQELNKLYSNKDKNLYMLYDKIADLAENHDVFIVNYENVYYPEFIKSLKNIYTVIVSGDDPESSDRCSKPYVHAFDHSFAWGVNFDKDTKIAEKFLEWGAKRADWWPYGIIGDTYNTLLTEDDIYNNDRDIDLVFVSAPWLKLERIAILKRAFPQMKIYGQSYWKTIVGSGINALRSSNFPKEAFKATFAGLWRVKELPADRLVPLYQRCKIGINIHLSYGPMNLRLYQLPANGMMQICDCPEGLGQVFEIGKEVVVYHSIEEAIELIKYYLEHDDERKKIAVAGFKRVMKDYGRLHTFSKAIEKIKRGMLEDEIMSFKVGTPIKLNAI